MTDIQTGAEAAPIPETSDDPHISAADKELMIRLRDALHELPE